jgi:hypothetical protein
MLRPPGSASSSFPQTGIRTLDYELAGEMAAALGHSGRQAQQSVTNLLAFVGNESEGAAILKKAVDAVYAYFIQRELAGMRNHEEIIRALHIPREVIVRLGSC